MAALYDLALEGTALADIFAVEDVEITPELEQRLFDLMIEGPDKIEAAALAVRDLEFCEAACRMEIDRLKQRAEQFAKNADRLKAQMTLVLDKIFSGKVKTPTITIWTQKSPDTTTFDMKENFSLELLHHTHPQFVRVKLELDKAALRDASKLGDTLPEAVSVSLNPGTRYTRIK